MRKSLIRAVAVAALLGLVGCARSSIVGSWSGRDEEGAVVVYSFARDGTGYRVTAGTQETLTYEMTEGYPNLLGITVGAPGGSETREGLVEIRPGGRMRLELGEPGGPRPAQLTDQALELSKPATR